MYRIRKVKFRNHPILKNLSLDFCDRFGNVIDTIIFAGENGTGKSTILEELYNVSCFNVKNELDLEIEDDEKIVQLSYRFSKNSLMYLSIDNKKLGYIGSDIVKNQIPFCGIYSDVDINFHSDGIASVTSNDLDVDNNSRKSSNNLPTEINQLLIDIQAVDDSKVALAARQNPHLAHDQLNVEERMPRFTNAFNTMFQDLSYSRVDNKEGKKVIIFNKFGDDVSIEKLSSGEKQIVYRGSFLLKDLNALRGAFVFIDEPEISLHPRWQMRILNYYKSLFTNKVGVQTSQLFVVTHSPFVIHNDSRFNDKVIILDRDNKGEIIVNDRPEYFICDSLKVVEEAFSIEPIINDIPTVFLEGRTDEMYFNKALEVFEIKPFFEFKWIGYIDEKGQEANTGKDALTRARSFLVSRNLPIVNVCLYDCDANKTETRLNNVIEMSMPRYQNDKNISAGIENALVFGDIDINGFKKHRISKDEYDNEKKIPYFEKMKCCEYICSLDKEVLKEVFVHLKENIENINNTLLRSD